jgi:hypothetical protein
MKGNNKDLRSFLPGLDWGVFSFAADIAVFNVMLMNIISMKYMRCDSDEMGI